MAVLRRYAEFTGRSSRAEYWYFFLGYLVLSFLLGFLLGVVGAVVGLSSAQLDLYVNILRWLLILAFVIPIIAVSIRRMHDVDKSGWFMWVPFYNIYLDVSPGTVGDNRFGPDPKATTIPVLATGSAPDSVAN